MRPLKDSCGVQFKAYLSLSVHEGFGRRRDACNVPKRRARNADDAMKRFSTNQDIVPLPFDKGVVMRRGYRG